MWTLLVTVDRGFLMFSIAYNIVCVPKYSVTPLTSTDLEKARHIRQLRIILMYFVKSQRRAEFFSFQLDICIPIRINCKSNNNAERSYYNCGNVVLSNRQAKITDFVTNAYRDYFEVKLGEQDKPFTPQICCKTCVENLRN